MYALYARQSIDKRESISIESQVEACKLKTMGNSYKIYTDKGYSGKNTDRPQFQQMMNDIKNGLITHVVVYRLDRISRSILDFAAMMDTFEIYKVEFISHTESFDTSSAIGKAMLSICIVFAQLERETIQQRVMDAYYARSKRGFFMGGKVPYGYAIEDTFIDGKKTSKFIENPEESEHVRLMYELYANPDNSLGDIIKYFIAHGIKHLRNGNWNTARISEILRNPVYVQADADIYTFFAGQGTNIINSVSEFTGEQSCYLYKGTETANSRKSSLKDKELVLAPHKGIISSELWLKCRVRCMNNKQSTKTNKARNSWLLGKIKCGKCGNRLDLTKAKTKMGRYFLCGTMLATKKSACTGTGGTLYADILEETLLNKIKEKLTTFEKLSQNEANKTQPRINEIKIKIAQLDKEIETLVGKVGMANDVLMRYINEQILKLDNDRKSLNNELVKLTHGISKETLSAISDHTENWEKLSFEDKQTVVDTLIDVIHVADGKIHIKWRI